MKLADLDRHPGGNQPLRLALRWLETLTTTPDMVRWSQGQHAAATAALAEARELLGADVLTLAGRVYPRTREAQATGKAAELLAVLPPIDPAWAHQAHCTDASYCGQPELHQPLAMTPLAGFCRCGIPRIACHPECPHGPRVEYDEADDLEARAVSHLGRHTCTSCRFLDTCGAHQEPCSHCTIGAGQGGGHTDRWEART